MRNGYIVRFVRIPLSSWFKEKPTVKPPFWGSHKKKVSHPFEGLTNSPSSPSVGFFQDGEGVMVDSLGRCLNPCFA